MPANYVCAVPDLTKSDSLKSSSNHNICLTICTTLAVCGKPSCLSKLRHLTAVTVYVLIGLRTSMNSSSSDFFNTHIQ